MHTVDAAGLGIGDDHPTRLMGVLNISKESPYKPSVFDDPASAAAYVDEKLIDEGADIVDIGLESANKKLDVLSAEQELDRLDTAIETIDSVSDDAVYSIETRYHEVAEEALERGFDMVNDIAGFADPEMPAVCDEYDAAVAKMASPPDLTRPGAVEETDWTERKSAAWAEQAEYVDQVYEALTQNGFTDKTIIDPAFGRWSEAQSSEDDRETFRRLREFRGLGRPMLVSINRKTFLRTLAGRDTEQALSVSLAATSMAIERGAHIIRTHDVAETRDAAKIGDAFTPERTHDDDIGVEELDVRTVGDAGRHLDRIKAEAATAGDAVVHVFEVSGLSAADSRRLADAADTAGAAVARGENGDMLVGTPSALVALDGAVSGDETLGPVLSVVTDGFD